MGNSKNKNNTTYLSKLRDTLYFFTVLSASSPTWAAVGPDNAMFLELFADIPLLLSCNADNAERFPVPGMAELDSVGLLI